MPQRVETPHPNFVHLVTGHFEHHHVAAWRERGTADWLLIYTVAGRARCGYEGGEILALPGDILLLRPGTRHDYGEETTVRRWELLWTHFHPKPDWLDLLLWPEEAPGLMRLSLPPGEARDRILARFFDVHRLASSAFPRHTRFAMNALEEVLLLCDALNPRSQTARLDARIERTLHYLNRHLAESLSLADLAQVSGLSVSRLSHLFHRQVGITPQQYQEAQRLSRAKQLLELTRRPIQAIAEEVGFENPFYFSLRFKRQTGLSPRAYRKRLEE